MTVDEIAAETVDVLFQLEVSGCHLAADDGGLHVYTPPAMTRLGDDLVTRLDGVLGPVLAVVAAEQYLREVHQ